MISAWWLLPIFILGGVVLFLPIAWFLGWTIEDGMVEETYERKLKP